MTRGFYLKTNNFELWFLHISDLRIYPTETKTEINRMKHFKAKKRPRQNLSHCGSDKSVNGTNGNQSCNSFIRGLVKITVTIPFLVNMEWVMHLFRDLFKYVIKRTNLQNSQFVLKH